MRARAERRADRPVHLAGLLVPLIGLSLAPHQEPRFLLPLIHPIARLTAVGIEAVDARARRLIWVRLDCSIESETIRSPG